MQTIDQSQFLKEALNIINQNKVCAGFEIRFRKNKEREAGIHEVICFAQHELIPGVYQLHKVYDYEL